MAELAINWRILFNNVKVLERKCGRLKKRKDKMPHISNKFHVVLTLIARLI